MTESMVHMGHNTKEHIDPVHICGRQSLFKQTLALLIFLRLSPTNFTSFIFEYFVSNF